MECEALSIEDKVATVHSALRVAGLVGGSRRLIDKRIFSVLVLFLVSSRVESCVVSTNTKPRGRIAAGFWKSQARFDLPSSHLARALLHFVRSVRFCEVGRYFSAELAVCSLL